MYFTLKFWTKVPFSTSSTLYRRTGEDQVVVVVFQQDILDTANTPTMSVGTIATIATTTATIPVTTVSAVNVEVKYINQPSTTVAPTRNEVLASANNLASDSAGSRNISLTGLEAGNTYTIYMLAIGANGNIATNLVSRTFSTLPTSAVAIEGSGTLEISSSGVLNASKDSLTITLTGATFADNIVKADVTATNLNSGLDFTITRTSPTVLTIQLTGTAASGSRSTISNLTFAVSRTRIILANGNNPTIGLTTASLTVTAV
jgi:hypothetical protein